jgi:hypothetical protein|nr:MAG TPA: hypothetical protein [Caudoviricetes sp.]
MELLALDADFEPVGYLPYINLQWTREYYTAGQYSVQVAAGDYDPRMAYLYTPERPEMGVIHKVERTENIKGRFIQISGYFLERLLWDKVLWPTYYASGGTIPEAVTAMIQQYKGDIPLLEVLDAPAVSTLDTAVWQETGGELGAVAYKQLQTVACSLRCRYDYNANKIYCGVWQGTDRTQGQTANPFVTFADSFGNLISAEASRDKSNYKNYAIIAGQDKAENRITAVADLSGGGYKKMLYKDSRASRWDENEQSREDYIAGLQQEGYEALLDYQIINNVDVEASAGGYKYLEDWDLGDKVDVIVEDIGLALEARIVTVREVFKQNNHKISIEMGDKKLTMLDKARLIH